MKKKLGSLIILLSFTCILLTGCGKDAELTTFKNEMDVFCSDISEIDFNINSIDASSEKATEELLSYLDQLDSEFIEFANMNFPEEFNYLNDLSIESSEYMTEAVSSYHDLFSAEIYDESLAEYAKENYSRAYTRVKVILSYMHGEEPTEDF